MTPHRLEPLDTDKIAAARVAAHFIHYHAAMYNPHGPDSDLGETRDQIDEAYDYLQQTLDDATKLLHTLQKGNRHAA